MKFTPTAGGAQTGELAIANSATASPIGATLSRHRRDLHHQPGAERDDVRQQRRVRISRPRTRTTATRAPTGRGIDGGGLPADADRQPRASPRRSARSPSTCRRPRPGPPAPRPSRSSARPTAAPAPRWCPRPRYTFNPSTGNTVSFNLPSGTNDQYLELSFTANSGWTAAQLAEFEIFPGSGYLRRQRHADRLADLALLRQRDRGLDQRGAERDGAPTPAARRRRSRRSRPAAASPRRTPAAAPWPRAPPAPRASPSPRRRPEPPPASLTVVEQRDQQHPDGRACPAPAPAAPPAPTNLALNQPITASSATSGFPATNANDGSTSTYWESTDGTWPSTLAVDLGTTDAISSVVARPPRRAGRPAPRRSRSWAARTTTPGRRWWPRRRTRGTRPQQHRDDRPALGHDVTVTSNWTSPPTTSRTARRSRNSR